MPPPAPFGRIAHFESDDPHGPPVALELHFDQYHFEYSTVDPSSFDRKQYASQRPCVIDFIKGTRDGDPNEANLIIVIGNARVTVPAVEVEAFDAQLEALRHGIHDGETSVQGAVLRALTDVGVRLNQVKDDTVQYDAELRGLQAGRAPGPSDSRDAVALIERELPSARPHLLAQLVEPHPGTTWQQAIEGYMGGDRFAIIVEAGMEARCARLVKRHYPVRSPKVVQGRKAMDDTEGRRLEERAMLHELVCKHPVANAFLLAQYGRVRKVDNGSASP